MKLNKSILLAFVMIILSCTTAKLPISTTEAPLVKKQFLLFWRSDCSGCHTAIPQLVRKASELDSNSFTITSISFDTDSISYFSALETLKMQQFENKHNFKQGFANNELAKKFGVTKTPTLLCIDNQANIVANGNEAFAILCNLPKLPKK